MAQDLLPGDFLVYQLESGFGLLRVLAVEEAANDTVWHLAAYSELFLDVEMADAAVVAENLSVSHPHLALTNRAFESTQVAQLRNIPLNETDIQDYEIWKTDDERKVSDRSIRLLLGLR
ncbi:MAG: hypothetical protein AB7F88_17990 [Pyrinomonadaceae bacterium]